MEEMVICECGLFWKRVLRRVEERINLALQKGYKISQWHIVPKLRIAVVVTMERGEER